MHWWSPQEIQQILQPQFDPQQVFQIGSIYQVDSTPPQEIKYQWQSNSQETGTDLETVC